MSHAPASITLAQLPSFDHCVHPERPLRDVFDLLETNDRLPGVLIFDQGRFVTALSRVKLLDMMRRRFSHEIFWEKPVNQLLDHWSVAPTLLSAQTTVTDAIARALARQDDALTEPIVCVDTRNRHTLIDMHTLLAAQCRQLAFANDQLAEVNRACEMASKAKTDFLANMSHEIRTPMTAILGYAELLQDPETDQAQRTAAVRTIRRSGEHLLNLLNDILDVSKIEAGRFELERLDHDPVALLREIIELMSPRASEKGVRLTLAVDPGVPPLVHTDPTRIRQIVSNLIGNAIKFTQNGRVSVKVTLEQTQGQPNERTLSISVQDTGIGIAAESLANLFQPFVQGDATMSRRYGGTGLGLTISRTLARLLGGDITVTSTVGQGSCFTATVNAGLDKVSVLPQPKPAAEVKTAVGPLRGRILLAEDGLDNQRLFNLHLTKAGATVDLAADGHRAVELATALGSAYGLILMDMQMPGMDGYEATRRLRDMGYFGPIVALTAHAMSADRERAMEAGCDDYLTKPIARDALIRACQKWLNFKPRRLAA